MAQLMHRPYILLPVACGVITQEHHWLEREP